MHPVPEEEEYLAMLRIIPIEMGFGYTEIRGNVPQKSSFVALCFGCPGPIKSTFYNGIGGEYECSLVL